MHETSPTLVRVGISILIVVAAVIVLLTTYAVGKQKSSAIINQYDTRRLSDNISDFQAMESYNKPIPVPQVVAALEKYGTPETFCLQMEDLRGTGSPYPFAYDNPEEVHKLVEKLKNYYDKKVYVYMAKPNGVLQLCVSELPHSSNPDGSNQRWEVR